MDNAADWRHPASPHFFGNTPLRFRSLGDAAVQNAFVPPFVHRIGHDTFD